MIDPIPISALEHYAYCPRQCALIHVDGMWSENVHTVRGRFGHRRADANFQRSERGRLVLRAVPLWSDHLALAGRADAIEISGDEVVPVEYKMGTRHGDAAEIQVCAQALCLEEMLGVPVRSAAVWYAGPRRRRAVELDEGLRSRTLEVIDAVRRLFGSPVLPGAPDDARCAECQLLGHCLPGIVAHPRRVDAYMRTEVFACG